uniref:Uncharacterized protein n=1 Tax=Skeletonema marinoi TaxID=267567 RepID=A0A7S2M1F5_9STRA|mmetsp:Transcript_32542/g.54982  ORF Transcript_32542/g.54982 Transcript_32542/m.54982 type:complete len:499 (+) Transcript_32542:71-1567(+)
MTNNDNNIPLVDLTTTSQKIRFDSEEDKAAFGINRCYRDLYKKQIYKLKQNDANFCMLSVNRYSVSGNLSEDICDRIGLYLWRNSHIKNITLTGCGLLYEHMERLFSRIVDQHEQNESNNYLKKHDILEKILNVGDTSLTGHVMGYLALTPFTKLFHVDLSGNFVGTDGLAVLFKAIAGAPVEELRLNSCLLEDLSPLIIGARKLKELKLLSLNDNRLYSTAGNAQALSVLFDGGYPRLQQLFLGDCNINSELIETSAPALLSNKTLWHCHMFNNLIGDRGVEALSKAIGDWTSFEKIITSNHTLRKILVGGDWITSVSEKKLQRLSMINFYPGLSPAIRTQKINRVACRKLFTLLSDHDDIDPSMFLYYDIGIVPLIFSKLLNMQQCPLLTKELLTAFYKILKCKVFQKKLSQAKKLQINRDALRKEEEETRMKNEQLEADNAALSEENRRLKEQIASLMAQNSTDSKTNYLEAEQNVGSIAERVKTRAKRRKRGRK